MRQILWIVIAALGTAALGGVLLSGEPRWVQVLGMGIFFAIIGTAWNIQAGFAGVLGLGNAAFIAIGAYTTIILANHGISPWVGMWVGMALSVAFGVLVSAVALRASLRGIAYGLATFASAQVLYFWLIEFEVTGGAAGVRIEDLAPSAAFMRFSDGRGYLVLGGLFLAVTLFVSAAIYRSRLGLTLLAVRENEAAAAMSGVPVLRYQLIAVAVSAALTSMGGTFYAQLQFSASPAALLGLAMALNTVIYAVIGGFGRTLGAVVGAALLVGVSELTNALGGSGPDGAAVQMVIYGAIIMLTSLFLPRGLLSIGSHGPSAPRSRRYATGEVAPTPGMVPEGESVVAR